MKKIFPRSLIALSIVCFLSLSFSMQDQTLRNPGIYAPIPRIQNPTPIRPQDIQTNLNIPEGLSDREAAQIQLGDYTSTIKRRSILAVDVDNDGRQELVVDFGGLGVYVYDPLRSPQWRRISTMNPVFMIAADRNGDGSYEIYANWGSGNGSEYWEDGIGWKFFGNTAHDYQGFYSADINDDGNEEVVVKTNYPASSNYYLFIAQWGGYGFDWHEIHVGNTYGTHAVAFNTSDDELVTYFPDSPKLRFWNYASGDSDWTDNWTSMADVEVQIEDCTAANVDTDAEEEFIVDIWAPPASEGTWIYNYSSSPKWTRINGESIYDVRPWRMTTGSTSDILVFQINLIWGLWLYGPLYTPKWIRINGLNPEGDEGFVEVFNYDSDSDWDIAVDFGGAGLWKYDYYGTPKWTSMNGSDPRYMIKANVDNDSDDELIVVFETSPAGIWIWDNSTTPKWQRINGANPD